MANCCDTLKSGIKQFTDGSAPEVFRLLISIWWALMESVITSEMYGMLVHSCLVEDGQGEKFEVIDANGFVTH